MIRRRHRGPAPVPAPVPAPTPAPAPAPTPSPTTIMTTSSFVFVTDYAGCDPTGVTNSNAAFISAQNAIAAGAHGPKGSENSNNIGFKSIHIPPGTYLLTSSGALLNSSHWGSRTCGVEFVGDGAPGTVVIYYQPSVAGPCMVNNDTLLNLRFKNIQFHGTDANSDLMNSTSNGGSQDYQFDNCIFSGTWKRGIYLNGGNNNSEFKFDTCDHYGSWQAFLYADGATGSDQFLNYWFDHCKYESNSPWVDMAVGGSIKFTDGDVSGYDPSSQTYLFNLRGNGHSLGVTNFSVKGMRFEQKTAQAGIMYSEWGFGQIRFSDCDFSSQAYQPYAPSQISCLFDQGDNEGCNVVWDNCAIQGKHQYISGNGAMGQGRVSYRDCDFDNFDFPDDAIVFGGGGLIGLRPVVRMTGCRGTGVDGVFADAEVGWQDVAGATVRRKVISIKDWDGTGLPSAGYGPQIVKLPLHAIITRVTINLPANCNTSGSTTAGFTVKAGSTTIATLNLALYKNGGSVDATTFFRCDTRANGVISLVPKAGNDQTAGNGSVCLVEYIG